MSKASGALSAVSLITGEILEELTLLRQDLGDPLIHAFFGKQAVNLDRLELSHPVGPGDGLPLSGGLELRFADHDDRGSLDVQPDSAGDDLRDQHRAMTGRRELVDHDLSRGGRHRAGERAEDLARQCARLLVEHARGSGRTR